MASLDCWIKFRYFSSLSRKACSACLRSVISLTFPCKPIGLPFSFKNTLPEISTGTSSPCLLNNFDYDKDGKRRCYDKDHPINDAYSFDTVIDPSEKDPWDIKRQNRIFKADFSPFGSDLYLFKYSFDLDGGRKDAITNFYLNNEFYGLRPFAVIDLFFYKSIDENFKLLKKDLYQVVNAVVPW